MTTDSPIPQHASERLYSRTRSAADDSRNARRLCESGSVDGEAARVGLLDLRRAASQHHCPRGGLLGTTMQHAATLRRPRGGEELAASTPSRGTRPWQRRAPSVVTMSRGAVMRSVPAYQSFSTISPRLAQSPAVRYSRSAAELERVSVSVCVCPVKHPRREDWSKFTFLHQKIWRR